MSRRLAKLVCAVFTAVILALAVTGVFSMLYGNSKETKVIAFEHGTRPEGEPLGWRLPHPNDEEAAIAFVAALYNKACENYQKTEDAAFLVKSSNLMLGIDVPGYRYCVKNGDEYRYLEYSFIDDNGDSQGMAFLSAIMGVVAADSTRFALAQYTDGTMDKMVARRAVVGKNAEYVDRTINDDGSVTFDVDWSSATETEVDKPIYCASQDGAFRHTDHTVNVETITEAKITYNSEEGYYICEFTLDPEVAPLERTLASLKANSGMDNAHYTSLKQVMHIWDNGYFKYYMAEDKWKGMMDSVITFHTTYYYDEVYTDISNYQYMDEMCRK